MPENLGPGDYSWYECRGCWGTTLWLSRLGLAKVTPGGWAGGELTDQLPGGRGDRIDKTTLSLIGTIGRAEGVLTVAPEIVSTVAVMDGNGKVVEKVTSACLPWLRTYRVGWMEPCC